MQSLTGVISAIDPRVIALGVALILGVLSLVTGVSEIAAQSDSFCHNAPYMCTHWLGDGCGSDCVPWLGSCCWP